MICLRPVDGTKLDAIGEFEPIDGGDVESATYPRPDPSAAGDFTGTRLVHDTVRLNLRSGAGPFRSLDRLSVKPRPYQYVLLLMALRLDPVRLLIADDVSVGKTIEAGMVARELLDRGAIRRIAVLCAPHLCDQWAEELVSKFHIEATVMQSSTMARLERGLPPGHIGVFRHYPHLVASIDLIRDRDRASGRDGVARAQRLGSETIWTPVRAPHANAVAERWVGTLRRACVHHIMPFNARHLQRIVQAFVASCTETCPHRPRDLHPPAGPRAPQRPGRVVAPPMLGGLQHRDERAAA